MLAHHYICTECHQTFPVDPTLMVCPKCSSKQRPDEPLRGVLEVEYLDKVNKLDSIFDLMPVEREFFPDMPVGNTALWSPAKLRAKLKLPNLFFKDDGQNPTCSFKDRASYLVAAFAKKHKIDRIVLASTGNAGSSMSGIGANSGITIKLFLPKSAPPAKIVQALQYGADVITVDGNYDMAYDLSMEYSKKYGGMNRNTAYNPMTIEGKKSVSLEIFKQLGKAPDVVFVPTGDGCILGGVYKGFNDLLKMGLIKKMPKMVAVQAETSNALYRAFHNNGQFTNIPTSTIADSICVDVPRNGYHALSYLKRFEGDVITVTDQEIISAQKALSETTGLFTEPAGATAHAGLLKYQKQLNPNETIVVLATGSGLKDTATAQKGAPAMPKPIKTLNDLK